MKKTRIFAACLLVLSLLLTPFTPVSAAEDTASETTEVTRVEEIVSLRETNSETYLMSDGTYECVIFSEDKYYRDSNDALQLIDNSIVAVSEGAGLMAVTQYQNAANAFELTLTGSGTPEVSIAYQGAGVTFSPIGATRQGTMQMTASDTVIAIGAVDNCAALEQLTATGSNTATYTNAFPTTDLVYVLENDALKEYIILKDASAPNEFSFLFELDGLTMQTVDGFTHFVNGNEEAVFTLGSLFAVDANGKPTDALTYDFVPVKGNADQVIVTVTLDNDYLTATDRAFPVVIDPTITVSSSQTADSCVCEYFPTTNYYLATVLRTGYDTDYGRRRSYLKFNIPTTIPAGGVTNATLDIEMASGAVPTTRAYRVISSWTSSTLTWNNRPGYTTINQSTQSVPFREGSIWYTMNVTAIVQSWVNGTQGNYGFVVIDDNESDANHWTTWNSSDAVSPHKPELIINYSEYSGCKSYVANMSQSVNCQGYAFFTGNSPVLLQSYDFVRIYEIKSTSRALTITKTAMESWLNKNFAGKWAYGDLNSSLSEGQWLVAMRVGLQEVETDEWLYDYHFWYRTNNGQWANKHNKHPSELLPVSDLPTTNTSSGWAILHNDGSSIYFPEFYDSDIVYYILTE